MHTAAGLMVLDSAIQDQEPPAWESCAKPDDSARSTIHDDFDMISGEAAAGGNPENVFHLFPILPPELRLRVWHHAMGAAAANSRVHRVRCVITSPTDSDGDGCLEGTKLELEPTPALVDSTQGVRALMGACYESRIEILRCHSLLPDNLFLRGGGVLRCDLSKDVIMLDDVTVAFLVKFRQLGLEVEKMSDGLSGIEHLGLDILSDRETFMDAESGHPRCEAALVKFASSFPRLRQVYLLQPPAALDAAQAAEQRGRRAFAAARNHLFLGSSTVAEWYSTQPLSYYWVDGAYHGDLDCLTRVLCGFRFALDVPPIMTDLNVEALTRLPDIGLSILRHYRDAAHAPSTQRHLVAIREFPDFICWSETIMADDGSVAEPIEVA
ncbi:hypothetical protein B0T24DRAFT_22647 [Lasiosphaeria ovina]|uniref:2EXR domain-containing protein n=1 Tax=Lasiosphaeria ovina TaxID=92902 RepID=A0AAE0NJW6_9PEZI|nr:hypothetical protein B0T24DRAFT_22647 [Lasiosphaeria ovina]